MFSQNKNEEQSEYFNEAENFLKLSKHDNINLYGAINNFFIAYLYNKENNIGKISKNKIDSIKPIIRSILVSKWKGKWKRISPLTDSEDTFIEVKNENFSLYTVSPNSSKHNIVLNEEIKFYEYKLDNIGLIDDLWNLEFSNNEIWNFVLKAEINEEFLYTILKTDSNGITTIKHRPIYRYEREVNIYEDEIKYERVK